MLGTEIEYFKSGSPVHRLHPFTKVAFELALFAVIAVFSDIVYQLAVIAAVFGVSRLAQIPLRKFRYLWTVIAIGVFLVFTQGIWFTSFGDFGGVQRQWHTLFYLWPAWAPGGPRVPFVLEGCIYGVSLALRFVAIALGFPILVMTTHPSDLVTALAEVRIGTWKIPYSLIFIFATALRYVPTVSRTFSQTIDAQRTRGVVFEGWNLLRRVRASVPLLVPVIVSSMVHAQDLTIALETRAFGSPNERTFVHEVLWRRADTLVTVGIVMLGLLCILAEVFWGFGRLPFAPSRSV
jgi:energy-coupling factor transport system permease protein